MSIRLKIEEKYINAIKSKNREETNAIRLIKSAIKDKDIDNRTKDNNTEINFISKPLPPIPKDYSLYLKGWLNIMKKYSRK